MCLTLIAEAWPSCIRPWSGLGCPGEAASGHKWWPSQSQARVVPGRRGWARAAQLSLVCIRARIPVVRGPFTLSDYQRHLDWLSICGDGVTLKYQALFYNYKLQSLCGLI